MAKTGVSDLCTSKLVLVQINTCESQLTEAELDAEVEYTPEIFFLNIFSFMCFSYLFHSFSALQSARAAVHM